MPRTMSTNKQHLCAVRLEWYTALRVCMWQCAHVIDKKSTHTQPCGQLVAGNITLTKREKGNKEKG